MNELESLRMIVDSGAPMLILSAGWLEKYLREMEVDARDVEERSCNRRFRFGKKVYKSFKEVTMVIVMKVEDEDYVRKIIDMNVIYREVDLFLCGLKTLREWKASVFYEKNEMEFSLTKKRVSSKILKGGY